MRYLIDFRAPTDCTQYFTGEAGNLMSYNYNNGVGPMMVNLNYVMCFRQEEGETLQF